MKNFFRTLNALLNSRYYPLVNPNIDLRYRLPRKQLGQMKVLNVGVGSGESGLARQLPFIEFGSLTLIDVHQPYLDIAKMKVWDAKETIFINSDVRNFPVENYDLVLMFDVMEHLPKEDSIAILKKIKGKQVLFGPLETHYRKNDFEVESQDHLSMWIEQDFIDLGYKTEVLKNFHCEDKEFFDAVWALK